MSPLGNSWEVSGPVFTALPRRAGLRKQRELGLLLGKAQTPHPGLLPAPTAPVLDMVGSDRAQIRALCPRSWDTSRRQTG